MSKCPSPAVLSWACALLQSASSLEPPHRHRPLSRPVGRRGTSHEVCSPSAYPRSQQQHQWLGLPHPAACALRFSRPLDAFLIHREPAGLVSCRIRSWGCALQSFPPAAWPYAVSGADPLLALVPLDSISTSRSRSRPRRPKPPRTRTAAAFPPRPKPRRAEPLPPISTRPKPCRAERSPNPRAPQRSAGYRSTH
jgi:hypothetical protein